MFQIYSLTVLDVIVTCWSLNLERISQIQARKDYLSLLFTIFFFHHHADLPFKFHINSGIYTNLKPNSQQIPIWEKSFYHDYLTFITNTRVTETWAIFTMWVIHLNFNIKSCKHPMDFRRGGKRHFGEMRGIWLWSFWGFLVEWGRGPSWVISSLLQLSA